MAPLLRAKFLVFTETNHCLVWLMVLVVPSHHQQDTLLLACGGSAHHGRSVWRSKTHDTEVKEKRKAQGAMFPSRYHCNLKTSN
jgi:hypothetical protein